MEEQIIKCENCRDAVAKEVYEVHWTEGSQKNGYGHKGLCCDCFDLSCGMPLDLLNEERKAKGLQPLRHEWKCSTCNGSYPDDNMLCSNSFHCCRDCVWDWQVESLFTKGQVVEHCEAHKKRE